MMTKTSHADCGHIRWSCECVCVCVCACTHLSVTAVLRQGPPLATPEMTGISPDMKA